MALTSEHVQRLRQALRSTLKHEWPELKELYTRLRAQKVIPIPAKTPPPPIPIVAMVATDAGQTTLALEPIRIEVLRVADSNGEIHFEQFIPLSPGPEQILRFCFDSNPRLKNFIKWLGIRPDTLLPETEFQRANLVAMLRELLEWAALLKLAAQPAPKLLLHDGLLRSILLREPVFHAIRNHLEELTRQHGHLLAGVAKHSKVIDYLALALDMNGAFADGSPAYMKVPAELERQAAPAQYRWVGQRAMGQLYLARLGSGMDVPLLPVEVAAWQTERAHEAMLLLHHSARTNFPMRGYPSALTLAHQHAVLDGFETKLLEELLLEELTALNPGTTKTVLTHKLTRAQSFKAAAYD